MTSKERLKETLNHRKTDKIVVDFGATSVSGIHVLTVSRLRDYYGLPNLPVKVVEPYQMLGEIDQDLAEILGVDVVGISPRTNIFGFENNNWKAFRTFWGQEVLVPENFKTKIDSGGDLLLYPAGDTSAPPSAKMPKASYFFDTIIRQEPLDVYNLKLEDNLEEFSLLSDNDINYWKKQAPFIKNSDKGIILNLGGTALGDIALVPAPWLRNPKGIRDIEQWYMSTLVNIDFMKELFDKQSDIALKNLETLHRIVGNSIEAIFMCGTDFGTQVSQFCSPDSFDDLYLPYYKKMNDWIHQNTSWKTFKHSCGAIMPLMPNLIEAGFDIINPVQINAADMNSQVLKDRFGDKVTFWGGGVDTQKMLSFGTPAEVEKQVLKQCEVLSNNGGFVFNTVHNIQATVPVENIDAMIKAITIFNGTME
jgi:hypothetical protein